MRLESLRALIDSVKAGEGFATTQNGLVYEVFVFLENLSGEPVGLWVFVTVDGTMPFGKAKLSIEKANALIMSVPDSTDDKEVSQSAIRQWLSFEERIELESMPSIQTEVDGFIANLERIYNKLYKAVQPKRKRGRPKKVK